MKCIIVDDEPKARKVLEKLISIHCPELEVAALCENLGQARTALLEQAPDLVFLDLHLPDEFGLELVNQLKQRRFGLVLTTAHPGYALQGYEINAQDYLLKPILSTRLVEAVGKARLFVDAQAISQPLAAPDRSPRVGKIPLPVEDGIALIDVERIVRVEASGSYCKVHLTAGKPLLISKHLKSVETLLVDFPFYRVHNSHLINLNHLTKVQRTDGGFAIMSDGKEIEVSRRRMAGFLRFLELG